MRTTSTCVDSGAVWVALTDCLSTVAVQALASTATDRTYTLRMGLLPFSGTRGVQCQAAPKVKENLNKGEPTRRYRRDPSPYSAGGSCPATVASFASVRRARA